MNNARLPFLLLGLTLPLCLLSPVHGSDLSGGLTLIEPAGARPGALAEAFTSADNDVAAFPYNPASLTSLLTPQVSFFLRRGVADDSYGRVMGGLVKGKNGFGFSVGYYRGPEIELYEGDTVSVVSGQKDLSLSAGYSRRLGRWHMAAALKYLSSQLIESLKAQAYAADVGLIYSVRRHLLVGAAVQNMGTQLKFAEDGDPLPRLARTGLQISHQRAQYKASLFADLLYRLNEQETEPALGLEVGGGPIALRAGWRETAHGSQFSMGTGLMMAGLSFDYAIGLLDTDAQHTISLTYRFGANPSSQPQMALAFPILGPITDNK